MACRTLVGIDLGWYVNTQHADEPNLCLDFARPDHELAGGDPEQERDR